MSTVSPRRSAIGASASKASGGAASMLRLTAPIDGAGAQTAYVAVAWPGSVQAARKALERFDQEWWLTKAPITAARLTFIYELV